MTIRAKYSYRKTIRIDEHLKSIIEKNFADVCRHTGLKLSYGKIARAFWVSLAENSKLRKQCMDLVCRSLIKDANDKGRLQWKKKKTKTLKKR